ncbi:cryptochrome/photolyase family protein [Glaciibacter sp. 2TAF33]|uniref:cryptochrome/photolyase family protein n=1 Tax=Glaciibacter sp. 2TAF33 TaxID=3233015 RepID=UPI003F8F9129
MTKRPSIVWLRDDLRLADNPALAAAVARGAPVVVVYVLDEESPGIRLLGGANRWWLHHSLNALAHSIGDLGGRLLLRRGSAAVEIPRLVTETDAAVVYWNRRYGASREIDADLKVALRAEGVEVSSFQANLLFEPWTVTTGAGSPFRVFTPFWRACLERPRPRDPLPPPTALTALAAPASASDALEDWHLLPTRPDWSEGLRHKWRPGEAAASARLEHFAADVLAEYHRRDEPAREATSHLSPHLRFGEISPFQVWHRVRHTGNQGAGTNAAKFLSELGWREFNWNILFHFPQLAERNFRPEFDEFPWKEAHPAEVEAWQQGRTGIPLVDAGMRELWRTGYMHNRVRLVTASFLVKNLLFNWRIGERWFWDCLVDADEASNAANWQWVAGSGADAAPYFRVFNPLLQAQKFDPDRAYVDRWVSDDALYPPPIVDLAQSRRDALAAYDTIKRTPSVPPAAV